MKYEKIERLYVCCGQYLAPLPSYKGKVICPRCGEELAVKQRLPKITLIKK